MQTRAISPDLILLGENVLLPNLQLPGVLGLTAAAQPENVQTRGTGPISSRRKERKDRKKKKTETETETRGTLFVRSFPWG